MVRKVRRGKLERKKLSQEGREGEKRKQTALHVFFLPFIPFFSQVVQGQNKGKIKRPLIPRSLKDECIASYDFVYCFDVQTVHYRPCSCALGYCYIGLKEIFFNATRESLGQEEEDRESL